VTQDREFFEWVVDATKSEEGFRSKPYLDSKRVLTIGWGTNIAQGIDHTEADFLLRHRLTLAWRDCLRLFPWFGRLNNARKAVILQMAYQMGVSGVFAFRKMRDAIEREDWDAAADEMLDSDWHREDSPARAQRLARVMRSGSLQTSALPESKRA
jgi:lysozyme